ncbi:MAG: hypothetical protein JNK82_02280 [Myxococcaceae bacterium]|nr:hypothetical protein [Myxococcaceae bacterium]
MRLLSTLTLLCFTVAACAHNPARPITPNDEEVQVHEEAMTPEVDYGDSTRGYDDGKAPKVQPVFFTRANAGLDEQEFYQSISDTSSYDAVVSSRRTGAFLQGTGVGLAVLGFTAALAGVASYFLSNTEMFPGRPVPLGDDLRMPVFYGAIGSAIVGGLGVALAIAMGPKVRGDSLIFPLTHARRQLEVSLYGENGATPDDIKSLTFGAGNEKDMICGGGSLNLAPVVAKDAKGRVMRVSERADWFEWKTAPRPGLVTTSPDAPVLASPVQGTNFADIDAPVTFSLSIPGTSVAHAMTFEQTFGCQGYISREGAPGSSGGTGESGKSGQSGNSSHGTGSGGMGGDGKDGKDGRDGPEVVAEVAWVTTPKRGRLALLVVDGEARLFDPSVAKATVSVAGGSGGSGGTGGHGGSGGGGQIGRCQSGGDGGQGGKGGRGGDGGRGGRLTIRASDQALLDAVTGLAPGGAAGSGGSGGGAGSGGSGSTCKGKGAGWAPKGASGTSGNRGNPGQSGQDGTVTEELASVSSLGGVADVIAQNPSLTLEGGGALAGPAKATKKNRRR